MDFKFDLSKLEKVLSNNFSSLSYVILANEYMKDNDLNRAYTVLQIGQENNPDDAIGKYLLAKIYLLKNNIKKSKKLLSDVLDMFPLHLNARQLMIEILKQEKANQDDLAHHIGKLQEYFPNYGGPKYKKSSKVIIQKEKSLIDKKSISKNKKKEIKSKISIDENMATFTLVNILVAQKHFEEALSVLTILEKKGKDPKKIKAKRAKIKEKMKS